MRIFGETPEEILADVAAMLAEVDTHLFRLDHDAFYELMADRFEVARGIIRMLCRRVRAREYEG